MNVNDKNLFEDQKQRIVEYKKTKNLLCNAKN